MKLTAKVGKRMGRGVERLFKINGAELVCLLVLALYAGLAAPALPNVLIEMADSLLGRIVFLFLIGYVASKNIKVALMVAVAFSVTLHIANKRVTESYINALRYERFVNGAGYERFHDEDEHASEETPLTGPPPQAGSPVTSEDSTEDAGTYTHTHEHTHTKDIPEPSLASLEATSGQTGSVDAAGGHSNFSNYEGFWGGAQGSSEQVTCPQCGLATCDC
jgi:hypothetical protein